MTAAKIIKERAKTHGDYSANAHVAQGLKEHMRASARWALLTEDMRESLELIATKIGRILSGNAHHVDHWRDGAGYFELIADKLEDE
jgi:hypothetical protein